MSFRSVVGPIIARYVQLKEALGRQFAAERRVLQHLDTFLADRRTDLTQASFVRWCNTGAHLSSTVRRNRMRVVRNLCLYRRRKHRECFVPDSSQFPPLHQPVQPHIFTDDEITKILAGVDELRSSNNSPLRRENFRLALVLLYTTGLRRGELLRLTVGDYDPNERALLVRESKFHKSRLLPLSLDGSREMDAYLRIRRQRGVPLDTDAPLLWNYSKGGRGYTGVGFGSTMRSLFCAAHILTAAGHCPRVHDLRHSFAVNALLRWYRAGEDVESKLPLLAAYMGHVSVVSTQYYLHFVEPVATSASERFARRCGALVWLDPRRNRGLS